ncbi:hypothetical protein QWY22_11395 [Planococcus liqunii]|uniref:Uncharacterized protein n=1 Tax=Planococcus liqunii TaxID=3058394 RepID=A0ABT8MLF5_9BACL|nr:MULTISPECIES: hypothetical protein [unclassified Planococcus (in: firmicutes)]MDN7225711.1 hypothetical protein [Planococcus sp. N064]WKA49507.1 hypothetical protein QWY22_11395 [Planococcus sp. N056]
MGLPVSIFNSKFIQSFPVSFTLDENLFCLLSAFIMYAGRFSRFTGFGSANLYYTCRLLFWGKACLFQCLLAAFQKISGFFSVFNPSGHMGKCWYIAIGKPFTDLPMLELMVAPNKLLLFFKQTGW